MQDIDSTEHAVEQRLAAEVQAAEAELDAALVVARAELVQVGSLLSGLLPEAPAAAASDTRVVAAAGPYEQAVAESVP